MLKLSENAVAELLKDLHSSDDLMRLVSIADTLDRRGCVAAANEVDSLIKKIAAKSSQPGKTYAQWLRHLKKMNCPAKTVEKFKQEYRKELKRCKERGFNDPEKKALKKACATLPKKYMKEQMAADGHKSPPKKYKATGAKSKSDYADPENYKYPIHTEKNVRAALSYFSKPKNYNKYPAGKRSSIWGKIKAAAKKYKIELDPKNDPPWGKK